MSSRIFSLLLAALGVLGIYLFVTAPPKLPEQGSTPAGSAVPIEAAFKIIAHQQATARAIYTAEIVGPGQKAGLKFGERWKNEEVEEGPFARVAVAGSRRKHQANRGADRLVSGFGFSHFAFKQICRHASEPV